MCIAFSDFVNVILYVGQEVRDWVLHWALGEALGASTPPTWMQVAEIFRGIAVLVANRVVDILVFNGEEQ